MTQVAASVHGARRPGPLPGPPRSCPAGVLPKSTGAGGPCATGPSATRPASVSGEETHAAPRG
eukprot:15475657-Alexandrium_andersonii.AAC.1